MHNFMDKYSKEKDKEGKETFSKTQKGIVTYAKKVILKETESGYREGFYQINIKLNDSDESVLLFPELYNKYDDIKVGEHVNYIKKFQLISFEEFLSHFPENERAALIESYNGEIPETFEKIVEEDVSLAREHIK